LLNRLRSYSLTGRTPYDLQFHPQDHAVTWLQIVVLAIVQGLTEFLPVSSSGHLVLVPSALGWADQGLPFDVAVHFGSLVAVCVYFRRDVAAMFLGGTQLLRLKNDTRESRLAFVLGIGTIPAAVVGLTLATWIEGHMRDPAVVVITLSGYAVIMILADRFGRRERTVAGVKLSDAIWIGCAQALALIPGTSRSGVTISAARALGFHRQDAARFSFLLSVPVILLASAYKAFEMLTASVPVPWGELGFAALISAIVAYLSIGFFMRVVSRIGLLPFAAYRLVLAAVVLYVLV
jgi:undecaprenyl-diphosphatase